MDRFATLLVFLLLFVVSAYQLHKAGGDCDVSNGSWVYDDSYPLCNASSCPSILGAFDCFDTWHWWLHVGRKQPWDLLQVGNQTYKDMDRLVAYEKALNTWATGVDSNVDPAKTKVFFQGVSPDHQNASDWTLNPKSEAMNCTAESKPLHGGGSDYPRAHPAEQVVEKPRKCYITCQSQPGRLLNVTSLSQLRKDGHPSVYGLALTETHG
ncbi:hypothetical protein M0R45_021092 [Rubus argutus]|uniref:Trichome birefringence-like C-terminal domain-containing protein n=1 Tax=Rubus argutus TaxID=59490 RepID=A0AAW1XBH7_RUBAR